MVIVAQLVEHRFVAPEVAGSSPVDHPSKSVYATASVVKLVDTRDLGSRAERRGGSSPSARTESAHISGRVYMTANYSHGIFAGIAQW
jgi:hypothetical protein